MDPVTGAPSVLTVTFVILAPCSGLTVIPSVVLASVVPEAGVIWRYLAPGVPTAVPTADGSSWTAAGLLVLQAAAVSAIAVRTTNLLTLRVRLLRGNTATPPVDPVPSGYPSPRSRP